MSAIKSTGILTASSLAVMCCQILTVHLYARRLSESDLAIYLVATAASVIIAPFLSLGINDSLLYYVGLYRDNNAKSLRIFFTSLYIFILMSLAAICCMLCAPRLLSKLFFSNSHSSTLVAIAALLALSRFSYASYYRYLNAMRRMFLPAILEFLIMGILPLVIIYIGRPLSVEWLLAETATATFVVWLPLAISDALKTEGRVALYPDTRIATMLIGYGLQRVPTILGLVLILSSPVVLAEKLSFCREDVVVIGACMALLRMLGVSNQLATNVVLPRISWAQANKPEVLAKAMWLMLVFAAVTGIAASMGFLGTGDTVLRIWLHRESLGASGLTDLYWLSAMPFVTVFFLRPAIDALHFRAYNTVNVFISVTVMAVTIAFAQLILHSNNSIGYGVLLGGISLSGLSVRTCRKLINGMVVPGLSTISFQLSVVIIGGIVLCVVAIYLRAWLDRGAVNPYLGIGIMGVFASSYFLASAQVLYRTWRDKSLGDKPLQS